MDLTKHYWDQRYKTQATGWDIGYVSTPLKTYFDQLEQKLLKILIPGAGNAYEAEYLHSKGFTNVWVADWSPTALSNLQQRVPSFPKHHLINADFFKLEGTFDLMIEQTFFCALPPKLRSRYAQKSSELLQPNGRLVGLLFNDALNTDKPPFGGNQEEYVTYFEPYFNLRVFESCYNSIPQRAERELFINLGVK